jgi:hypothetical protein
VTKREREREREREEKREFGDLFVCLFIYKRVLEFGLGEGFKCYKEGRV